MPIAVTLLQLYTAFDDIKLLYLLVVEVSLNGVLYGGPSPIYEGS